MERLDKLLRGKQGRARRRSDLDRASETCAGDRERRNKMVRRLRARRAGKTDEGPRQARPAAADIATQLSIPRSSVKSYLDADHWQPPVTASSHSCAEPTQETTP